MSNLSASSLATSDPQLKDVNFEKYSKPASDDVVEKTRKALEAKTHKVTVVNNKAEALETLKNLVPKGASVMNAGSMTLVKIKKYVWIYFFGQIEIGFTEYLKTQTEWNNLHGKILAETDQAKQAQLRREALLADYYLSSVSAVTEDGNFVIFVFL